MRIIRTLMVLTGVTVFMPSPPDEPSGKTDMVAQDSAAVPGLLSSATLAIADIASFCGRQPDVCQTAGFVADKLEAKAKYSVKLIYEWANEAGGVAPEGPVPSDQATADPITTSSAKTNLAMAPESQSTLRLEDIIPEWRGPPPKKKG